MPPDCLFCKIATGEVAADVVRETPDVVSFRDINPQAPSHVLVVPRAHYRDVSELAQQGELLTAVLREATAVAGDEGLESYRMVFNTGAGAGQTVFHVHAHVLGGRGMAWPPG